MMHLRALVIPERVELRRQEAFRDTTADLKQT